MGLIDLLATGGKTHTESQPVEKWNLKDGVAKKDQQRAPSESTFKSQNKRPFKILQAVLDRSSILASDIFGAFASKKKRKKCFDF